MPTTPTLGLSAADSAGCRTVDRVAVGAELAGHRRHGEPAAQGVDEVPPVVVAEARHAAVVYAVPVQRSEKRGLLDVQAAGESAGPPHLLLQACQFTFRVEGRVVRPRQSTAL